MDKHIKNEVLKQLSTFKSSDNTYGIYYKEEQIFLGNFIIYIHRKIHIHRIIHII